MSGSLILGTGKLASRLLPGKHDDVITSTICLRWYHQAMDIAGLSKLSADTITLIVGILGFLVSPLYRARTRLLNDRSLRNSDLL